MDLKALTAEKFGIPVEKVTDAQIAAIQAIVDASKDEALPNADETAATKAAIDKLQTDLDEEKTARIGVEQMLAELKDKPGIDPDSDRIAHDGLPRMKTIPDISTQQPGTQQDEKEKAAHQAWDNLHTLSVLFHNKNTGALKPVKDLAYWRQLEVEAPGFAKALDTATSLEGADWAPTEYGTQMIEAVWDQTVVAPIFPRIPMPRSPYTLPFSMTGGTVYLAGEATSDSPADYTASTPATAAKTWTAKKLAMLVNLSEELEEESIVPVLPQLRNVIAKDMAEGIEDAILDGQATGAIDSDVTSSGDRRMAWDGLRYFVTQTLTTAWKSFATFDGDNAINAVVSVMTQKYLPDAVWLFPSKKKYDVITIVDDSTNKNPLILRSTPLGDGAIVSGNSPDLLGNPVIFSPRMRTNLNASGVYDATTTTKTWACLVNRNAWVIGDRRELRLEVDRQVRKGQSAIVGTIRLAFSLVQPATDVHTGGGYNY